MKMLNAGQQVVDGSIMREIIQADLWEGRACARRWSEQGQGRVGTGPIDRVQQAKRRERLGGHWAALGGAF